MKYLSNRRFLLVLILVDIILLLGVLLFINPESKSLIYIFLPILLVWIAVFNILKLIDTILFKKNKKIHTVLIFVGTSLLVLLLLLSGIGQLTLRDVFLSSGLAVVSSFYFYRSWA